MIFGSERRTKMCTQDASTMQGLSAASTVAGTLVQMKAARDQASYQANIANQNAAIANAQAVSAGEQGAYEQSQIRKQAREVAGSQKAALAANGLDTSAGSPLAILAGTAYQGEQNAQISRYNTALQMWGYENQANQYRDQAKFAKQAGKNAATSSLLTGLTDLQKQYATLNNKKIITPNTASTSNYSGLNLGYDTSTANNALNLGYNPNLPTGNKLKYGKIFTKYGVI
jgi:hypothetical protein